MRIDVVTVFPDYLAPLQLSLIGRAVASGIVDLRVHDLRTWTHDRHRTVDDTPYGGGAGMVMRPDVWGEAIDELLGLSSPEGAARTDEPEAERAAPVELIVTSPSGDVFDQELALELARCPALIFACGRYEGIDARVAEHYRSAAPKHVRVREVSIGDYVLAGGEAAALVMIEAIARLVPGVLGNPESLKEESHGPDGLLEYPIYTKPPTWRGLSVPEVLLSGDHGRIAAWRHEQAVARTRERRSDLLADSADERAQDAATLRPVPVDPSDVAD